jgi:hypothetical protein
VAAVLLSVFDLQALVGQMNKLILVCDRVLRGACTDVALLVKVNLIFAIHESPDPNVKLSHLVK